MPAVALGVPVYYAVIGGVTVAFTSIAAYYSALKSGDVPSLSEIRGSLGTVNDLKNWFTGDKNDGLVSLEELGLVESQTTASEFSEAGTYQVWSDSFSSAENSNAQIKANKIAATNYDILDQSTLSASTQAVHVSPNIFENAEVRTQVQELEVLKVQKSTMIHSKEWEKLSPNSKTFYNNQVQHKEIALNNTVQTIKQDHRTMTKPSYTIKKKQGYTVKPLDPVSIKKNKAHSISPSPATAHSVTQKQAYEIKQTPAYTVDQVAPHKVSIAESQSIKKGKQWEIHKAPPVAIQNVHQSKVETKVINKAQVRVLPIAQAKVIAVPKDKIIYPPVAFADTMAPNHPGNDKGHIAEPNEINLDTEQSVAGESDSGLEVTVPLPYKNKKRKTKTVMKKNIGENILYNLEPYTYEFTLSAMSREEYAKGGSYEVASRQNIIIKSSGLPKGSSSSASEHANEFAGTSKQLAPGSQLNHHIRGVFLKSVIGLNSQTITSNTHNFEFTVFEPFGASLLDDLHDAAVSVGFSNYLRGIYLLTLKFHGYDDDGKPTPWGGVGRAKFFPLKIINCSLNVSGGGTEYTFEAVPYNGNALEDNKVKITQPINLVGSTAGELLFELQEQLNEQPRISDDQSEGGYSIQIVGNPDAVTTGDIETDREIELIRTAALKGTPKSILIGPGGDQGTMAGDLFNSTMNHDARSLSQCKVSIELTPEGKKLHASEFSNGSMSSAIKFNSEYQKRVYTWNRGTSVLDIIQAIVDASDYILRQVKGVEEMNIKANANGEIPWYKIDYKFVDASSTKTTNRYLVRPYLIDQYIALPNLNTSVKYNVKEVAREYNYIYTGENRDILDFDLQYNFAFYTALSAQEDKTPGDAGDSIAQSDVLEKKKKSFTHPRNRVKDDGKVVIETKVTDHDSRSTTQGGELGSVVGYKKASIIKEQLSNPMADLINLELEILGDPFYLVQEDFDPGLLPRSEVNAYELKDGSVDANRGEVYLQINFKTPVDLDEESGKFKGLHGVGKYDTSFFGGFFQLYEIESTFEEGKFTQRLHLVRCRYQELESPKEKIPEKSGGDPLSEKRKRKANMQGSSSNVSEGVDTENDGLAAAGMSKNEPFSVSSEIKKETQTEANVENGFQSAMATQKGDLASIGIDQNNLMGNFANPGGNPVNSVMEFAIANDQKKKNGATDVLSSDTGEGQANVVSGLNEPEKKMGMNESLGLEKAKFNQSLPGENAGQAEFATMQKDMGGMGLSFDMFSGGSGSGLMAGGNPVSNLLAFAKKDQKNKNEKILSQKDEGKKKITKKEEVVGNKVIKTEEVILENDEGEQEITETVEIIGTDKYLGMTREEYYSGKSATTGEVTYRTMRWRNRERIQEEGKGMGLSDKEIQKMIKHFNKSHPNPEWEKRKNKRELLKKKIHG